MHENVCLDYYLNGRDYRGRAIYAPDGYLYPIDESTGRAGRVKLSDADGNYDYSPNCIGVILYL